MLQRLRRAGYLLPADCGGEGNCGKCRIKIIGSPPAPDEIERKWITAREIKNGWRLACRCYSAGTVRIEYRRDWKLRFSLTAAGNPPQPEQIGLAVDIGTTGLIAALVDISSGSPFLWARGYNPQRAWGADVMTRLLAARNPETLRNLQQIITQGIQSALNELKKGINLSPNLTPERTLAVGNTAMIHLAAGQPESTLSVFPFRSPLESQPFIPLTLGADTLRLAGPLQGYIGSDLLAVVQLVAPQLNGEPALLIDLGTNSEIALWDGSQFWVTSCAAGPAFEGGGISCGAPAGPTVAQGVQYDGRHCRLLPETDQPKTGLCGSALIALLAQLRRSGRLSPEGRLARGNSLLIQKKPPQLSLTQKDVRALQLAKAAIHAGVRILTRRAKPEISRIMVTGAFARNLKAADLREIGIVPAGAAEIALISDGALRGAAHALAASASPFQELRPKLQAINLADEKDFEAYFIQGMRLEPMVLRG